MDQTPKRLFTGAIVFGFLAVIGSVVEVRDPTIPSIALTGCRLTPEQAKTANDIQDAVLNVGELACVMGGLGANLVDPEAIAQVCKITNGLEKILPVIRELVGVRDAAKRSGVVYHAPGPVTSDAGR